MKRDWRREGGELARSCLEEIRKRGERGRILSEWERERKEFFEERGMEWDKVRGGGAE